ncbi:2-oxoglutarate dehydrogenase, mitochondrial [Armadillidium vulgare]|nr:2-oxoglutarate dehydrogenase, mitochondrial [Armadillidium vulgare]
MIHISMSWDAFFRNARAGASPGEAYIAPPSLAEPKPNHIPLAAVTPVVTGAAATIGTTTGVPEKIIDDHAAVQGVIRAYQIRGHRIANLDPLGINVADPQNAQELVCRGYMTQFNDEDKDRHYKLPRTTFIGGNEKTLPLKEIIKRLENAYCKSIGVEFMFLNSLEQCNWIRKRFETPGIMKMDNTEKRLLLARLTRSHGFEAFWPENFPQRNDLDLKDVKF